ncbi:hypothetical protein K432DRAFT_81276 [Lepidopterella palustris CBS 459.81]|uniref:Uncharacterized protein n=1 Tax=Lepidopterella palustris CBS 459.81 TaxID=1314670 RepID=A0A8E2E7Q0_9PEZI|nr:hypothetical protein K432DRAFT_81276 [Lepidopterella palustris CBS 459.81]
MHFETSPQSSPSSKPISIGTMASPQSLFGSNQDVTPSSRGSTCAYPSWPTGNSLAFRTSAPSSFISDLDLFPEDLDEESGFGYAPLLHEAPAPPRQPPLAQAFPLLPLYASEKPKKQRRRSSGRKQRRPSKPMTPISESPEAPE